MGSSAEGFLPIQGPIITGYNIDVLGETQGDIIYFDGTKWVRLGQSTGLLHGGTTPSYSLLADADVSATAAIALSKLATGALPTGITIVDANVLAAAAIAKSKISTSGTWGLADLPTGTGYLHSSAGTNVYQAIPLTDFPSGTGFLKGTGGTPSYVSIALTDLPSGTGILKGSASTPTYVTPLLEADLPTTTAFTDKANTFGAFLQKFQGGANFSLVDPTDTTKIAQFVLSGITTATTRSYTLPNTSDTIAVLGLAQTFSALQTFGNNISFGGATLNVATLATGHVLQYNGTNWVNVAIGTIAATSVTNSDGTLTISPTVGAVVASIALGHANTWTGKQLFSLIDAGSFIADPTDNTKKLGFSLSGLTTAITLTLSSSQSTAQTLTIPNITAADTLATLGLAQTFTAKKIFTTSLLQLVDILDSSGNKILILTPAVSPVNQLTLLNAATGNPVQLQATGADTNIGLLHVPKGTGESIGDSETLIFALGDESTVPAATTNTIVIKNTYFAPRAGKLVWVEQCATIAPTSTATLDIQLNGTTIFSTKPTIAATAKTGSNGVLTNNPQTIAKGDRLEFCLYNIAASETIAGIKLTIGLYRTS